MQKKALKRNTYKQLSKKRKYKVKKENEATIRCDQKFMNYTTTTKT